MAPVREPEEDPGDRGGRVHRLAPRGPSAGAGARGALRRQSLHGHEAQHRTPAHPPAFRIPAPRHNPAAACRGGRDLQPRLSGLAGPLPARSGPDHEDIGAWRDQHARPRPALEGAHFPGVHERSLRRSAGASAEGELLGQCQPERAAGLLRRGQALRRDVVLRLSPPIRTRDQGGAAVQHLRAARASRSATSTMSSMRSCA